MDIFCVYFIGATSKSLKKKRKEKPSPLLSEVELEVIHEGRSAQMLHVCPYTEEEKTVRRS